MVASACAEGGPSTSALATSALTTPSPAAVTSPAPSDSAAVADSVVGHLTSGPTCPVEANPPDPACAPRPLAGAGVIATNPGGFDVARAVSKADGSFGLALAPGTYVLTPQPTSDRMLRPPAGKTVTISGTSTSPVVVDFSYDTRIR